MFKAVLLAELNNIPNKLILILCRDDHRNAMNLFHQLQRLLVRPVKQHQLRYTSNLLTP